MKINIQGKEYNIGFNMAVQIRFEELSGQPFDLEKMTTQKATMQLCFAALEESNANIPFTFDEMNKKLTMQETADLKYTVIAAMNEWFGIPAVMQKDEEQATEEGQEKNV